MPPSKRKKRLSSSEPDDGQITMLDITPRSSTSLSGRDQDLNNVGKGLAKLPPEMIPEIISWYHSVENDSTLVNGTNNQSRDPLVQGADSNSRKRKKHRSPGCIPLIFSERTNVLRALSATCRTYRIIFLPFLWDRLDICFAPRTWADDVNAEAMEPVYREVAESMIRKCNGILENPHLAPMIRSVNAIFTRYKMSEALPAFARCLRILSNLRTIHILYANPHMPNVLKSAFKEVNLPNVRTVIIPGVCHELLRRCPGAERVWCVQGSSDKLVTVIHTSCPNVEEVKGFQCQKDANAMRRLVKGIPTIRFLELRAPAFESVLDYLSQHLKLLPRLKRIDLRIPKQGAELEVEAVQRTVRRLRSILCSSARDMSLRCIYRYFMNNILDKSAIE